MACICGPDPATRCRWKDGHWFWWGHGLCAASLGLFAAGFELQLSGTRHVSFLAQQGKAKLNSSQFLPPHGKAGGRMGKKPLSDYSSCMSFGRENTAWLWARILPLSGKSLKTVILQTWGEGKACFLVCCGGFSSRHLPSFCCSTAPPCTWSASALWLFPLHRRGTLPLHSEKGWEKPFSYSIHCPAQHPEVA